MAPNEQCFGTQQRGPLELLERSTGLILIILTIARAAVVVGHGLAAPQCQVYSLALPFMLPSNFLTAATRASSCPRSRSMATPRGRPSASSWAPSATVSLRRAATRRAPRPASPPLLSRAAFARFTAPTPPAQTYLLGAGSTLQPGWQGRGRRARSGSGGATGWELERNERTTRSGVSVTLHGVCTRRARQ